MRTLSNQQKSNRILQKNMISAKGHNSSGISSYKELDDNLKSQNLFRRKLPKTPNSFNPEENHDITEYSTKVFENKYAESSQASRICPAENTVSETNNTVLAIDSHTFVKSRPKATVAVKKKQKRNSDIKSWKKIHHGWCSCLSGNGYELENCFEANEAYDLPIITEYSTSDENEAANNEEQTQNYMQSCCALLCCCIWPCTSNPTLQEAKIFRCRQYFREKCRCVDMNKEDLSVPNKATKALYLGSTTTILCKGNRSTDIALKKIWKSSHQGRTAVKILAAVENDSFTLLCRELVVENGDRKHDIARTIFHYRRITWCERSCNNGKIIAWIYRHEGRLKTEKLYCHAMMLRSKRTAAEMVQSLALNRKKALLDHQRNLRQGITVRVTTSSNRNTFALLSRKESKKLASENSRTLFPIVECQNDDK